MNIVSCEYFVDIGFVVFCVGFYVGLFVEF